MSMKLDEPTITDNLSNRYGLFYMEIVGEYQKLLIFQTRECRACLQVCSNDGVLWLGDVVHTCWNTPVFSIVIRQSL